MWAMVLAIACTVCNGRRVKVISQPVQHYPPREHESSSKVFAKLLLGVLNLSTGWQITGNSHRALPKHCRHACICSADRRLPAAPPVDGSEAQKKRAALLTFGYVGTDYYGLALQEDKEHLPTVGKAIRQALLQEGFIAESNYEPPSRTKWSTASRTDKGVHAACGAASVRLETYSADVIEQDQLEAAGDPDALDYAALVDRTNGTQQGAPAWSLSPAALERINAALPEEVRVFSGSRVSKRFDAREMATARVYEYLLPSHAVGASAAELDAVLRTFEGSHRMHNFASGLRVSDEKSKMFFSKIGEDGSTSPEVASKKRFANASASGGDNEFAWPLALDPSVRNAQAYRSVFTCRVLRTLQIDGHEYFLLRIAGSSFVLHQIRHMVGAALAVTNGIAPLDVMQIALSTPFRVDVAPLVPGCGLMLDEISWFSDSKGSYDARIPTDGRAAMAAFKEEVIYPHVHMLYQDGAYDSFLTELRNGSHCKHSTDEYEVLRRAHAAWRPHMKTLIERRKAIHAESKALEATEKPQVDDAKEEQPLRQGNLLPGGMYVELCKHFQVIPNPATHNAMQFLRTKAERGELEERRHEDLIRIVEAEHLIEFAQNQESATAPSIDVHF